MRGFTIGLVLALSFFATFYWIQNQATPTEVAVQSGRSARDPAAIRRAYDFSELNGSALSEKSKQRLISGFEVVRDADQVGVRLGHFVVADGSGNKVFACARYSKVVLSFEGEGVAVNGDKPEMQVTGNCETDDDINRISPLWIPVARITAEPVQDGKLDFEQGRSPVSVRFTNVSEQWPGLWVLTQVQLSNGAEDSVSIGGSELRSMLAKPVVIEFQ